MSTYSITLTPAEAKKVIAKGMIETDIFKKAFKKGKIFICYGTTNSYIVKEFIKTNFHKEHYVTGKTIPAKMKLNGKINAEEKAVIIDKGSVRRTADINEEFKTLTKDDIILKGANAVSHDLQKAGILVGHTTGGTVGAYQGPAYARRTPIIHPVGLEKVIAADLDYIAEKSQSQGSEGPVLWVSPGSVFTELDALEILIPGIQAYPFASGGIAGAEGSTRILIEGSDDTFLKTEQFLLNIRGEKNFI